MQIVQIGTQLTEALAGLERTQEIMAERPEDQDPKRTVVLRDIVGTVEFESVTFSYDGAHDVLRNISFLSQPGTVTALVGSSGSGKSTTIGLISAFYVPARYGSRGRRGLEHGPARFLPHAAGRRLAGIVPVRWHDPRERRFLAARR
jgi:ABC-type multidrug transport system fused ATPase/permease subunit